MEMVKAWGGLTVTNRLREKAAEIQSRITATEDKRAQYQHVAKWLNTVQTYQELSE
jgi:hypothetical protein